MKLTLNVGDERRMVRVVRREDRLTVVFEDGREVELRLLSERDGRFELEHGHARIHGAGVSRGCDRQVWANGRTLQYHCETTEPADSERDSSLASPLPAVVLEVLARPGDAVTTGQKLVLLESMKTVLTIRAPLDGVVRSVHCEPGDAVAAGVPLVEIGSADDQW